MTQSIIRWISHTWTPITQLLKNMKCSSCVLCQVITWSDFISLTQLVFLPGWHVKTRQSSLSICVTDKWTPWCVWATGRRLSAVAQGRKMGRTIKSCWSGVSFPQAELKVGLLSLQIIAEGVTFCRRPFIPGQKVVLDKQTSSALS